MRHTCLGIARAESSSERSVQHGQHTLCVADGQCMECSRHTLQGRARECRHRCIAPPLPNMSTGLPFRTQECRSCCSKVLTQAPCIQDGWAGRADQHARAPRSLLHRTVVPQRAVMPVWAPHAGRATLTFALAVWLAPQAHATRVVATTAAARRALCTSLDRRFGYRQIRWRRCTA